MDHQKHHPVVLIDGVCNLCQGITKFIIRHDPEGYFRFASLQSETGQKLLRDHGLAMPDIGESGPDYDTVVLIEQSRAYIRSDAAVRIAAKLQFPWNLTRVLSLIPRFMRNALYRYVAARRYRWFGREDACLLPTPDMAKRFLE